MDNYIVVQKIAISLKHFFLMTTSNKMYSNKNEFQLNIIKIFGKFFNNTMCNHSDGQLTCLFMRI